MKKVFCLISILILLSATSHAASQKEVKSALLEKYQITKRSLTGKIKSPGTVLFIRHPGMYAERPKSRVPETVIQDGAIVSLPDSAKEEGAVELRVGEPMHVYSIRAGRDQVRLQLGTESLYEYKSMGQPVQTHFQMAMIVKFDEPLESLEIEEVLADVAEIGVTQKEVDALPEMQTAIVELASEKALEVKEQQAKATIVSAEVEQRSVNKVRRPQTRVPQSQQRPAEKTAAELRTEQLRKQMEEGYAEFWDGQLASSDPWRNVADLFKYSPAKTMVELSKGHRIHLSVRDISFSSGSMKVEGRHLYTNIYKGIDEQVEREFGKQSGDYWNQWFNSMNSATKDRYVKIVCKVEPSDAAELKVGGEYVLLAELQDYTDIAYSEPVALMNCSDISPSQ